METREIDPFDKAGLFILKLVNLKKKVTPNEIKEILCISLKMTTLLLEHLSNENYIHKENDIFLIRDKGLKALEEDQLYKEDIENFENIITVSPIYVLPPYIYKKIDKEFEEEFNPPEMNFDDLLKNKSVYNVAPKWYKRTKESKEIHEYVGEILLKAKLKTENNKRRYIFLIEDELIKDEHPEYSKLLMELPDANDLISLIKKDLQIHFRFDNTINLTFDEFNIFDLELDQKNSIVLIDYFTKKILNQEKLINILLKNDGTYFFEIPVKTTDWVMYIPVNFRFKSNQLLNEFIFNIFLLNIEENRLIGNINDLWNDFLLKCSEIWNIKVDSKTHHEFSLNDYYKLKCSELYFAANLISSFIDFSNTLSRYETSKLNQLNVNIIRTEQNIEEIKKYYIESIKNAKEKIYLVNFLLESEEIINLIIEKFKKSNVRIYIITNLIKNLSKYKLYAKYFDCSVELINKTYTNINKLKDIGLVISGHENLHAKFCIIDDEITIISSANLETRSLNIITELGICFNNGNKFSLFLSKFFIYLYDKISNKLFLKNTKFIETKKPANIFVKENLEHEFTNLMEFPVWTIDVNENKFSLKDEKRKALYKQIIDLILDANQSIEIFTYSIDIVNENSKLLEMWKIIIDKIEKKNIQVSVILREKNFKYIEKDIKRFKDFRNNIKFYTHKDIHAKGIIIDNKHAVISSANFSEDFGLQKNIEMGWYFNRDVDNVAFNKILEFLLKIKANSKEI